LILSLATKTMINYPPNIHVFAFHQFDYLETKIIVIFQTKYILQKYYEIVKIHIQNLISKYFDLRTKKENNKVVQISTKIHHREQHFHSRNTISMCLIILYMSQVFRKIYVIMKNLNSIFILRCSPMTWVRTLKEY
jgi:hypothetical protein